MAGLGLVCPTLILNVIFEVVLAHNNYLSCPIGGNYSNLNTTLGYRWFIAAGNMFDNLPSWEPANRVVFMYANNNEWTASIIELTVGACLFPIVIVMITRDVPWLWLSWHDFSYLEDV